MWMNDPFITRVSSRVGGVGGVAGVVGGAVGGVDEDEDEDEDEEDDGAIDRAGFCCWTYSLLRHSGIDWTLTLEHASKKGWVRCWDGGWDACCSCMAPICVLNHVLSSTRGWRTASCWACSVTLRRSISTWSWNSCCCKVWSCCLVAGCRCFNRSSRWLCFRCLRSSFCCCLGSSFCSLSCSRRASRCCFSCSRCCFCCSRCCFSCSRCCWCCSHCNVKPRSLSSFSSVVNTSAGFSTARLVKSLSSSAGKGLIVLLS